MHTRVVSPWPTLAAHHPEEAVLQGYKVTYTEAAVHVNWVTSQPVGPELFALLPSPQDHPCHRTQISQYWEIKGGCVKE